MYSTRKSKLLLIHLNCYYITLQDCPHFLASRCQNGNGLRFHEMFPLSVTPYSVIWHCRSCVMVPTNRQALCHRLLGVDRESSMMSFDILRGKKLWFNLHVWGVDCGEWVCFQWYTLCYHDWFQIISHSFQPKTKTDPLCSQFSCAVVISKVWCGWGWKDRRNNEWQNNDCTTIADM